jgi:hypothetical protein
MNDTNEIIGLVRRNFDATWRGDVTQLRAVFDPRAKVAGEVDGQPYYKTIDELHAGTIDFPPIWMISRVRFCRIRIKHWARLSHAGVGECRRVTRLASAACGETDSTT